MALCYSCFKQYGDEFGLCPYCGTERITGPNEPVHLVPGTVLNGRYIIGTSIGEGGFGIVYKAFDTNFECVVAIKEFFSARLFTRYPGETEVRVNRKSLNEFRYRKSRFLTEARYIAKYNSNKNIVGVFDHFEENNTAYIVMELLKGMPLGSYVALHGGRLDQPLTLEIAGKVCLALKDLHKDNIIHCDIAPDNIFMMEGHEVKVFDFGAAKLADSADVAIDVCMKPGYSPPEQYDQSNNLGPWTDIYALGATLYVLLTGVKPDESTNRKLEDTVVPPMQLDPSIPENLSNAIMKAMAVEKHMRFKNVDDFMSALVGDKKVYTIEKEKKRRRRKRFVGIAAALVILAGVSAAVWHSYSDKKEEQVLKTATLEVWFSVKEGSNEEAAMESVKEDFEDKFPEVTLKLKAIDEADYEEAVRKAAEDGELPDLFESSGLPDELLKDVQDVTPILDTPQAGECLFLDKDSYEDYYGRSHKRLPLAIEVPVAAVITGGNTAVDYKKDVFEKASDFGTDVIAIDDDCRSLIEKNMKADWADRGAFMDNDKNTAAVMMSSTMHINDVREELINYQKSFVFLDSDEVHCDFIYEWSIGSDKTDEQRAAERLLSWMLGNVYQSKLMITIASDGQIPVNKNCFLEKCEGRNYKGMEKSYENYVFD